MSPETAASIVGVLLAAGRGARFDPSGQRLKLLEATTRGPHVDAPLAVAAARTLRYVVGHVIAVVAPPSDDCQLELHRLLQAEGCTLVVNPQAGEGQGTSIACGIAAASPAAGWIIALADMPAIQSDSIRRVVEALRKGAATAAPVYRGQRGHPVGFAATMQAELLASVGDTGARAVLMRHPPHLIEVDDPGVLYDVDTLEDR
jgi:molybdenum cofactor cytidylyltransferase